MATNRAGVEQDSGRLRLALWGACVGIMAGLVSAAFRATIEVGTRFTAPQGFEVLAPAWRFVLPIAGTAAAVGVMLMFGSAPLQTGVAHVLDRLAQGDTRLRFKNAVLQFIAASVLLVCGLSLGREGPAIHLGGASGSLLAQRFGLPEHAQRTLIGCGVAAATAAAFNTPLAGVLLALEVVLLEYRSDALPPMVIAAVTGTVIGGLLYGTQPAFALTHTPGVALRELPLIALCGIVLGAYAAAFIALVRTVLRLTGSWAWWLPMFAASIVVAICGLATPQILGVGYDVVQRTLLGQYAAGTLAALAILKVVATGIGIGARLPGGVIGPTLVMGAAAGASIGHIVHGVSLFESADVGLYAMLGMAAMMAASLRAPLAALIGVFELTGNPHVLLPGMLAVGTAMLTSHRLSDGKSVFRIQLDANAPLAARVTRC